MTAVTDTPAAPPEETAPTATDPNLDAVNQWAQDYMVKLTDATTQRLTQLGKNANGSKQGIEPHAGEPMVGSYVAFDVAATSPIQIIGLPPYQPSKVIAAGEAAYLVAYMFVNPVSGPPWGPVPPTVQLGWRNWRLSLDLMDVTDLTHTTLVQTGTYGANAPALSYAIFSLPTPDPGADPAVYEANVTFDISDPGQPYAAFATNFFDVDDDPGFVFVPPNPPGWRHELPNRYLVYRK